MIHTCYNCPIGPIGSIFSSIDHVNSNDDILLQAGVWLSTEWIPVGERAQWIKYRLRYYAWIEFFEFPYRGEYNLLIEKVASWQMPARPGPNQIRIRKITGISVASIDQQSSSCYLSTNWCTGCPSTIRLSATRFFLNSSPIDTHYNGALTQLWCSISSVSLRCMMLNFLKFSHFNIKVQYMWNNT